MNVLCPIDFSEASIDATKWIASFLNNVGNGTLHLTHFVYVMRRASMFMAVDDIFVDRAEKDLKMLTEELNRTCPNVTIKTSIFCAHPKEAIVSQALKEASDLIVTGSTGLTALKNITIGSVTAYIMQHSNIPVLAIPEGAKFRGLNKIALSVDDEIIEKLSSLSIIRDLCVLTDSVLHLLHITEKNESIFEYDPGIDMFFRDLKFKYNRLDINESIPKTINEYCHQNEMDVLCMVHRKRNWLQKLLQKSVTKTELFNLELPLLIVREL